MAARVLTRDEILAADRLVFEEVPAPELGEDAVVRVRAFSLEARQKYYGMIEKAKALASADIVCLVACSVVDDQGDLMFTEEDLAALGRKDAKLMDRIVEVAARVNGIGAQPAEAALKN